MPIQPVPFLDLSQSLSPSSGGIGIGRRSTQLAAIMASNNLGGQVAVMTTEGDRVTWNATLVQNLEMFSYHRTVRQASVTLDMSAKETQYLLEQKLGMTVEGNLNEQEVHDLLRLFENVLNLFRTFVRGRDETALDKVTKLAGRFDTLSTLSSLDLNVMVERSLTILTAHRAPAEPEQAPASVTTPSPTAVRATIDSLSSTTTTASFPPDSEASAERSVSSGPTDERKEVRLAGLFSLDKRALALVDRLVETLKHSSLEPDKLRKFLPRLLEQAREDLNKELNQDVVTKQTLSAHDGPLLSNPFLLTTQSVERTSLTLSVHT
ncbi:MAG: hypothetical protein NNA21_00285 [Nitrospira sp.]|nr:hypothetical protein [Nitrospira sp.]MCP9460829.1 hypothetical protein [Nitrospira sp.]MCP9474270.1 hypothetical protein [Nitrospira sp.]